MTPNNSFYQFAQGLVEVQEGEGAAGAVGEHGEEVRPLHHNEVAPLHSIVEINTAFLKKIICLPS